MKKLLIPVLLGLVFQSSAAFASNTSSSAEASFDWNAMSFSLIDLTPSDGLLPSVTWSGQHGNTSASTSSSESGHSSNISESYSAPLATSVVSSNAVSFFASGKSTYDNQKMTASSVADVSGMALGGSGYGNSSASASESASFSLSGAGVMVITVPYTIKVTGDLYNYSDYSSAGLYINGSYWSTDGSSSGSAYTNKNFTSYWSGNQEYSGTFTFSVANASDAIITNGSLSASLSTSARADNYTYVPGVPEPETYAMMLAGLGLIAARVRRASRKSV